MSKSILVIDTPECCEECPCVYNIEEPIGENICGMKGEELSYEQYNKEKPNWCPILKLPEKKQGNKYHNEYETGVVNGFNACVDEILKGENGNE